MRAVVQRVSAAAVSVAGEVVGRIDGGLLVLLGVGATDEARDVEWMADKLVGLRIFENDAGRFDAALPDVGGAVLLISQFTLFGDVRRGRRPSFSAAADPAHAEPLYERVAEAIRARGVPVATGRFGARMQVQLVNEGPVTILLDSRER